ncbi:MAG: ATP-binding protein [Planctomycetota bacterium]|nr:ATP-binding protein [Planctomycetota bacterium]
MHREATATVDKHPQALLVLLVVLPAIIFSWMAGSAWHSYRTLETLVNRDLRIAELRGKIVHLDEVLTMSASMAALTGNPAWENRYRAHEPELDRAIQEAKSLVPSAKGSEATRLTDEANMRLVALELRAFDLVRAGRSHEAWTLLDGMEYRAQKKSYAEGMRTFDTELHAAVDTALNAQLRQATQNIVLVFGSILVLAGFWILMLRRMRRWRHAVDASRAQLEAQSSLLLESNELLYREIEERKLAAEQLKRIQKEMMETSRRAGMAEVATGVLHNVGNVLTSVNVSSNLISDLLRRPKANGVGKVAALLKEHQDRLPEYFAAPERGRQVATYLDQLGQGLESERKEMLGELESLSKNIDHIKDIVSMQQSYAQVCGIVEPVALGSLVEDALRMNAAAMARHDVQVIRCFESNPVVEVDKHKIIQVLVNLIRNAKYALDDGGRAAKHMTLRIGMHGEDAAFVEVEDDGVGISEDHFQRIFSYGFSTRSGGHGFGLHSCALVAKEMRGSLSARSDGPGRGACFRLEMPLKYTVSEESSCPAL